MFSDEENTYRKPSVPPEAIESWGTVTTNTVGPFTLELDIETVLGIVPDATVIVGRDGIISVVNMQLEKLSGYATSELVGQSIEILLPQLLSESYARYRNIVSKSSVPREMDESEVMLRMRCKDGTEKPCNINLSPLKTKGGKLILASIRDLSELKKAQQPLEGKEKYYRKLLETTNATPWEADAQTWLFTYVGPQVEKMLGFARDQWKEKDFWTTHIHPDDRDQTIQICEQSSRKFDHYDFEYRMINSIGQVVWIHDLVNVIRVEGEPSVLRGFMIDVTESKKLSSRLREVHAEASHLKDRLKGLSESASISHCYRDNELSFMEINQYQADKSGLPKDQQISQNISEFIPEVDTVDPKLLAVIHSDKATRIFTYNPVKFDDGNVTDLDVADLDVTDLGVTDIDCGVNDVAEQSELENENSLLQKDIPLHHNHDEILGRSAPILDVLKLVEQVAPTNANVLLIGDTGTGKELMAREVHKLSLRTKRPMITVNCAALPATLIESELFGREKGAFTGALAKTLGRFEMADKATLFLDEIGELPLELQPKLLRVLQEGEFQRLGGTKTVKVDVRIIAATNRNLEEMVAEGLFRSDLYYRLSAFPIAIPPLRDLREDIPELVWAFVNEFADTMGKRIDTIRESTMQRLQNYQWPGNVRELRNVIERAMILSSSRDLEAVLPASPKSPANEKSLQLKDVEKTHILRVLDETEWRVRGDQGAAAILGLKPSTLESRMNKLGIKRK